jgi:MFS family permease
VIGRAAEVPAARKPLWRDPRFATYWAGQGISQLGDRVSELALPLIAVTMLHASSTEVGVLTAAVWAPNVLSLLTGAWVDGRRHKQPLLVLGDLIQSVAILSLPVVYWLGAITLLQLFAVALVAGAGGTLYQTAYPSFFVALVRRDQYVEANSLLSVTRSGSFIAGPALAGLLVQVLTAPMAMFVDSVSFLVSAFLIRRVKVDEPEPEPRAGRLLRHAADGMRYLWRHPYMSASLRCCTCLNFFSFVVNALLVLFASRHLGLSPAAIGLAFGLGALGGLVGAVLAGRTARLLGVGRTIALGAVLFSAPFALLPLASGSTWTKGGVLALVELFSAAGIMLFDVNLNALQTAVTSDAMRSRVSGAFSSVNYGIRPLGGIIGGVAGDLIGVGPTMVVAAVGGSLSALWLLRSPSIRTRTIDELRPVETRVS